jgi:hypothetical protein
MKTMKIMGIVGIVLSVLSFLCLVMFDNKWDYEAAIGWGLYASLYLLALSIVALVQSKKIK